MNLLNAFRLTRKSLTREQLKAQTYGSRRAHMMYYIYIDRIVAGIAADATSLVDVGTANAEYMERFDWIPKRYCIDLKNVYRSKGVTSIEADFFTWQPPFKFDLATCFQVLEHIDDAKAFAQRLLGVADNVLISVPYLWPEDANATHVHDPVDEAKVEAWFGRKPDYGVVVAEPLDNGPKSRRYIAYFHSGEKPLGFKRARTAMLERLSG